MREEELDPWACVRDRVKLLASQEAGVGWGGGSGDGMDEGAGYEDWRESYGLDSP
jgi:hypothetical protein